MLELRDVIARAFSNAELGHAFAVASLNFILTPFATTLSALFRRDLEFRTLAICNLAGTLVIALVSLALAMLGFSFMAPIWGMLAGNAVSVVLMMTARRNFRNFLPAFSGYTDVVRFGAYSGAISALSVFYNLAPQVFLGRNLGFTPVGLYNRALNAAQMFDKFVAQVVAPVIMPAIVAKAEAGKSLKLLYLEAIEILSVVQWPFLLWVALLAPSIIRIWLGPAWLDVVPLVRLLCIAQLALFGGYLTYPVLVAAGSVRDALIAALISLPPSLAMSFGASFFGAQALAASALVSLPLQAAVAIHFVTKRLAIGPAELFSAMAKSVVVTFSTSIGVLTCAVLVNARLIPSLAAILLSISLGAIGWWIGMVLTGHPLLVRLENASRNLPLRIPKSLFQIP
jgi:O-antigen/teichoic acid export membrane protein